MKWVNLTFIAVSIALVHKVTCVSAWLQHWELTGVDDAGTQGVPLVSRCRSQGVA